MRYRVIVTKNGKFYKTWIYRTKQFAEVITLRLNDLPGYHASILELTNDI